MSSVDEVRFSSLEAPPKPEPEEEKLPEYVVKTPEDLPGAYVVMEPHYREHHSWRGCSRIMKSREEAIARAEIRSKNPGLMGNPWPVLKIKAFCSIAKKTAKRTVVKGEKK